MYCQPKIQQNISHKKNEKPLAQLSRFAIVSPSQGKVPSDKQIRNSKLHQTMNTVAPEIQARIDGLLTSDPNTVSPEVAAAALADYKKRQEDDQRQTMVRRLGLVSSHTNDAVESLREARKAEKKAKAYLDSLAVAETAFKTNGNWDAYSKAKSDAENKLHSCE